MRRRRFSVTEACTPRRCQARPRSHSQDSQAFASHDSTTYRSWRHQLPYYAETFTNATFSNRRQASNLFHFAFAPPIDRLPYLSPTDLAAWLYEPLLVTNIQLSHFLLLAECTSRSPVPPACSKGHITYFRSWELSPSLFRKVLQALDRDEADTLAWRLALKTCAEDATITVRYVGTVQAPSTPWKRAEQRNERKGSLIGAFKACLQYFAPELAAPKVFAIVGTYVPVYGGGGGLYSKGCHELAECYERAFIRFFKPSTLLNSQPGGKSAAYGIDGDTELALARCATSLLYQLSTLCSTRNDQIIEAVESCFSKWFDYAREHIWDLNCPAPSSAFLHTSVLQAQPQQINGKTIAVVCGEDPPLETLKDGATFFSGGRATSAFVVETLRSIARQELGTEHPCLDRLFTVIGFNQLFNLPQTQLNKTHKERSRLSMDTWLGIVRPLLIFPLGQQATAWFNMNARRTPTPRMFLETGLPRLVYVPVVPPLPCIVIPHIHPGYLVRTKMSPALYNLTFLSWIASWVHMDVAARLAHTSEDTPRLDLCQLILGEAQKTLENAGYYELLQRATNAASVTQGSLQPTIILDAAGNEPPLLDSRKQLLERHLMQFTTGSRAQQPPSDKVPRKRPLATIDKYPYEYLDGKELRFSGSLAKTRFIATVELCGRAQGNENSDERAQQAKDLYDTGIPSLYQYGDLYSWKHCVLSQPRDFWVAGCLGVMVPPAGPSPRKRHQTPKTIGEHSVLKIVSEQKQQILQAAINQLMAEHAKWLSGRSIRGISVKVKMILLSELDGSKVNLSPRGHLRLRIKLPNEEECSVSVGVGKLAAPVHCDDFRIIHFTTGGVDIRDPQGTVLCPLSNDIEGSAGTREPNTFPRSRLRSLEGGKELLRLWKMLTNTESFTLNAPPAGKTIDKGKPIPKAVPQSGTSVRPVEECDALWLLDQYLDKYFPMGGEVWLGDKEHFPMGTDDVDRFTRFMQLPNYKDHPYAEAWMDRIAGRNAGAWTVPLACLREKVTQKWKNMSRNKHPEGKRGIQRAVFVISARTN